MDISAGIMMFLSIFVIIGGLIFFIRIAMRKSSETYKNKTFLYLWDQSPENNPQPEPSPPKIYEREVIHSLRNQLILLLKKTNEKLINLISHK